MRQAYLSELRAAGHKLSADDLGVSADTDDTELAELAAQLTAQFAGIGIDLLEPLDYLTVMRDDLAFDAAYDEFQDQHGLPHHHPANLPAITREDEAALNRLLDSSI